MRRTVLVAAFLIASGGVWADDSLQLPPSVRSDQVKTRGDQMEVKWPYGTITMKAPARAPTSADASAAPKNPRAWNRGQFNLKYALARDGGYLVPRNVRVTVENKTSFREDISGSKSALEAHEAMHRRINETEARRMERNLSTFRYKTTGSSSDMKRADALFRQEFHSKVKDVDQLHKEWDKNQIP